MRVPFVPAEPSSEPHHPIDPAAIEAIARRMLPVSGGPIVLRDEGTRRSWEVDVAPFLLSAVHLTRADYLAIMGAAPTAAAGPAAAAGAVVAGPGGAGPQTPMTEISWNDCVRLCNRLSAAAGLRPCYSGLGGVDAEEVVFDRSADGYRLPTEAEWELACRADSTEPRYGALDPIAWYIGNSGDVIHDVGTREPNAWGFYDMIGDAWEWCWDLFDPRVYGPYRVFRGGGFADRPRGCRASCRRKSHPTLRIEDVGVRLARSPGERGFDAPRGLPAKGGEGGEGGEGG